MKQFSFRKKQRLISNEQFKDVLSRGRKARDRLLKLYVARNNLAYSRLGLSVGKSCGNAVVRNRLKRLLREAFRRNQDRIPAGFDYLLMISYSRLKKTKYAKGSEKIAELPGFSRIQSSFLALVDKTLSERPKTADKPLVPDKNGA